MRGAPRRGGSCSFAGSEPTSPTDNSSSHLGSAGRRQHLGRLQYRDDPMERTSVTRPSEDCTDVRLPHHLQSEPHGLPIF
jgi:hypothetical protein